MFFGQDKPDPEKLEKFYEAMGWFDGYLSGHDWAVGDHITVADHSLAASVSTFEATGLDVAKYSNVVAWLERCKTSMPGYNDENLPAVMEFGKMAREKLGTK